MKLVTVDRALKELQNDTLFVRLCMPYIVVNTNTNASSTGTGVTVKLHEVNFTRYGACTKQLAGKNSLLSEVIDPRI